VTIKDLATQTGYSVGTISRVLNNHPNVSQKAREVILQAVAESGFSLNTNAKQLKQQQGNSILVVVKGTNNELFAELVEAIQGHFAKLKYPLIVDYIDEDRNEVARGAQLCTEKKPLGIFFLGGNQQNFRTHFDKIDVPCVLVSNSAAELPFSNLSSVYTDDFSASRDAMEYLIRLGHRKIVIIGGKNDGSDTSRLRFDGCMEAMTRHGVEFDPDTDYVGGRFSYQDGYYGTKKLLQNGRKFTALFTVAAVIAIGAIRALQDHGLRVPEDVSVMGFDGLPLSDYMVPRLSTVNQRVQLMACRSVDILLDAIEKGNPSCHDTIPYSIEQKESTLAASGRA
jgi:LacI family transcriptional regulator